MTGLIQEWTGHQVHRPTSVHDAGLIEFLTLFAAAFPEVAVRESDLGRLWNGLNELPPDDLVRWGRTLGG